MAQRMFRDASPSVSIATAAAIGPQSSFEEKLMLFQLFDRHDRLSNSCLSGSGISNSSILNQTFLPDGKSTFFFNVCYII